MKRQIAVASLMLALLAGGEAGRAEPVEVTQGESRGGGLAVRRGGNCYVLTAGHVVPEPGESIAVVDRSAARAEAKRIFYSENDDFALLQLPEKTAVACTERWEDPAWMRSRRFSPKDEVQIVHHSGLGKETIFLFRYAGGTGRDAELAPKDKLRIKQTDSGSPAYLGGQVVGILVAVSTEDDRVTLLRADFLDEKLGQILRGRGVDERVIALAPVLYNNRGVDDWTVYAREELGKAGIGTVVTGAAPAESCGLQARVINVGRTSQPNQQYADTEASYRNMCSRDRGGFAKYVCQNYQTQLKTMPRYVTAWTIEVDVALGRPAATLTTDLGRYSYTTDPQIPLDLAQRSLIGKSVAETAKRLVAAGACD